MEFIKHPEQAIRNYLWESQLDKSAIIQVSWKMVCQPKKNEGLDFKALSDCNNVAIARVFGDEREILANKIKKICFGS